MNIEQRILEKLGHLEIEMRAKSLWEEVPPSPDAFESVEPFAIDTMEAAQWLQWILIPRLTAMIDQVLCCRAIFAIAPYFEEIYKDDEEGRFIAFLDHLRELDSYFQFTVMGG